MFIVEHAFLHKNKQLLEYFVQQRLLINLNFSDNWTPNTFNSKVLSKTLERVTFPNITMAFYSCIPKEIRNFFVNKRLIMKMMKKKIKLNTYFLVKRLDVTNSSQNLIKLKKVKIYTYKIRRKIIIVRIMSH